MLTVRPSLEDGIREAIYSEVCAQEFPHGSIPMIAILDTGLTFSSPDATEIFDQGARRCIVIRPSTIRAAHANAQAAVGEYPFQATSMTNPPTSNAPAI